MIECIPFIARWHPYRRDAKLVKAAVRAGDKVYTGWRHGLIMQHMCLLGCQRVDHDDQGFIDDQGWFYDRLSAAALLHARGVLVRSTPLMSEDLWDNEGNPLLCQSTL